MIRLALHGGAGELAADAATPAATAEYRQALREIATQAGARLIAGDPAVDVVEEAVYRLEQCPLFNAGIGAVLNRDGQPELDAAIMSGADRRCGAVTGVQRSASPVRLARAIMERSPHVMFHGAGAEAVGRELGLAEVETAHFITERRIHQLKLAQTHGVIVLDHDDTGAVERDTAAFGTVGAVALDARGHLAAATSTGGLTNKHPGRIGDTPLIGCGTFADDLSAAVSCTGTGESFIRAQFGHAVHARMVYAGLSLADVCAQTMDDVARYAGRGGCIALDRHGRLAMPFNSNAMFRAWMTADGRIEVAVGSD